MYRLCMFIFNNSTRMLPLLTNYLNKIEMGQNEELNLLEWI